MKQEFSKYETARIIGARALQIAMNAPLLIKIEKEDLEKIKYDPIKIAEIELNSDVLPITVKRPFPEKKEEVLRRAKEKIVTDKEKEDKDTESAEEDKITKEEEIMELATPEDELEGDSETEEGFGED